MAVNWKASTKNDGNAIHISSIGSCNGSVKLLLNQRAMRSNVRERLLSQGPLWLP